MSAHDVAHSDDDLAFMAAGLAVIFAVIVVVFIAGMIAGRMTATPSCGSVEECTVRAEGGQ
ncbi:hypothetical protein ACHFJ0_04850 [Paracoccus sp. NGMCC 1.201697]|uniref:Uncharacterized protein n=1 Tax=Paracoccus broussonetiae subsp. drimophilus TaxID=3373869 RepID=A0ABW7LGU6_9RHOB